jgi:hypothetical protein
VWDVSFYPLLIVGILIGRSVLLRKAYLFPKEIACDMLDRSLEEDLEEELK